MTNFNEDKLARIADLVSASGTNSESVVKIIRDVLEIKEISADKNFSKENTNENRNFVDEGFYLFYSSKESPKLSLDVWEKRISPVNASISKWFKYILLDRDETCLSENEYMFENYSYFIKLEKEDIDYLNFQYNEVLLGIKAKYLLEESLDNEEIMEEAIIGDIQGNVETKGKYPWLDDKNNFVDIKSHGYNELQKFKEASAKVVERCNNDSEYRDKFFKDIGYYEIMESYEKDKKEHPENYPSESLDEFKNIRQAISFMETYLNNENTPKFERKYYNQRIRDLIKYVRHLEGKLK